MKVLKMIFVPVNGSKDLQRLHCQIEDKPFTWVIENQVYAIPEFMDCGPIDSDAIPVPIFENWINYGADGNWSAIIPSYIDLDSHPEAHKDLRLFGTLDMVPYVSNKDYKHKDEGLKAYLQFLLKTVYISRSANFEKDLIPIAKQVLQTWDKKNVYAFVSRVMGKNASNVSVADVAHVVGVISGNKVDITANNFELMAAVQSMSTTQACSSRPDEFFTAAFTGEMMELEIAKELLVRVSDEYYFGKGARWPKNWRFKGPEDVLWKVTIEGQTTTWAPKEGTLYDRALGSKSRIFPSLDSSIPFSLPLEQCTVLDSGAFEITPGNFQTGIKYLSIDNNSAIYKVSLASMDIDQLAQDVGAYVPLPSVDYADIVNALCSLYAKHSASIDNAMGEKHFLVYEKSLKSLGKTEEDREYWKNKSVSDSIEKIDIYMLPGMRATVRSILVYGWILKHIDSETLCYKAANNDDFTIQSLMEHIVSTITTSNKTLVMFLVNCVLSTSFSGRKVRATAISGIDKPAQFNIF